MRRRSNEDDDDFDPVPKPVPVFNANALVDPTFLFRFQTPIRYCEIDLKASSWELPAEYRLPAFSTLAGRPRFAEVRMGWSPSGLVFWMQAAGKRHLPWCRDGRPEESDGLHLWVDTRNSSDIQRASRYCHHFVFSPMGAGVKRDRPFSSLIAINRARENPQPAMPETLRVWAKLHSNGYQLSGVISSAALTGYDPREHAQIGFWWAVVDHELGWQTMTLSPDYPVSENPSLWSVAQLESK